MELLGLLLIVALIVLIITSFVVLPFALYARHKRSKAARAQGMTYADLSALMQARHKGKQ
jgi:type II secretory pathway pseudopilin PulG